jgi:NADH-quinone oxidoreductase subunit K
MMVPLSHYMALSAILFVIGAAGFIFRRNVITVFMCIELMLNAVNLAFIAFSRFRGNLDGQLFAFFVIVVAAAEAAVGLALILALFRNRDSLAIDELDSMKL